ncbi:MAG: YraN family protein [Pseudomonadota bacterium]|nr:YraN family protein [Pseudomonadota bacterium]
MVKICKWYAKKTKIFTYLNSYQKGLFAEKTARAFLERQGLKYLDQRYKTKLGEIDLVMLDHDILVFIEVKYRTKNCCYPINESISESKLRKINMTSQLFCQNFKLFHLSQRIDAVFIESNCNKNRIQWLKDIH